MEQCGTVISVSKAIRRTIFALFLVGLFGFDTLYSIFYAPKYEIENLIQVALLCVTTSGFVSRALPQEVIKK